MLPGSGVLHTSVSFYRIQSKLLRPFGTGGFLLVKRWLSTCRRRGHAAHAAAGHCGLLFLGQFRDQALGGQQGAGRCANGTFGGAWVGVVTSAVVRSPTYSSVCLTVAGSVMSPTKRTRCRCASLVSKFCPNTWYATVRAGRRR